jgi:hypothetical protein
MDLYGSDHYPTIDPKPFAESVDDCKRWRLTGADWDSFKDLCCSELRLTALEGSNDAFNQFKVVVKRLCDHTSIFSAEAIAIFLALDIISKSRLYKTSLSCKILCLVLML